MRRQGAHRRCTECSRQGRGTARGAGLGTGEGCTPPTPTPAGSSRQAVGKEGQAGLAVLHVRACVLVCLCVGQVGAKWEPRRGYATIQ